MLFPLFEVLNIYQFPIYSFPKREATAGYTADYFLSPVAVKPSGMQLSESSIMSPPKLYKTVQIFRIPGFP